MPGRAQDRDVRASGQDDGEASPAERPVVHCLLPRDLAPRFHESLRRHFRDDPALRVVVEHRARERRSGADRRAHPRGEPGPGAIERRLIRSRAGRRVAERRMLAVAVGAPPLPRRVRAHSCRLVFAERLEPPAQLAEDVDSARLVNRIQAGERELFATLYLRYFDRVYGYLRMLYRDGDAAEDAAQHVFLRALEGFAGYEGRGGGTFRGWLFTIARNHALSQLERSGRLTLLDREQIEARPDPNGDGDDLSSLDWVSDPELQLLIERMPLAQRQVLFLRYVVGLRFAEVSQVLGQSPAAVRQSHARALLFLRQRLTALGRSGGRRSKEVGAKLLIPRLRVMRARRYALAGPAPRG
jgi:RNA polymerase sigma-70 factor (ECF subfamily)